MTSTDEANALRKAICAAPDDDTPRLVYADWLQEHGDEPRAEFIRAQVELARIEGDDPRRPALARRELELLREHRPEWVKPKPLWPGDMVFRRGFVAEMSFAGRDVFERYAGQVFAAHPVTSVWLTGQESHLRAVARSPQLLRVRDLGVRGIEHHSLVRLIASQFATSLRGLHLQGMHRFDRLSRLADYLPLIDGPHVGAVTRLSIEYSGVNADEVKQFIRLKVLSNLTELMLYSDTNGDTVARGLATTPAVARLRVLRLRADRLTDAGVRHLAASPHLCELRRLTLFGARRITSEGFAALAASPHLRNLTDLDLRYTATPDDVRVLLALPRLSRVVLGSATGAWNACQPDHGPGVVWASELR